MHKKSAPTGEIPTGALLGEKETGTSRGPAGLKQMERPGRTGSTAAPPFPHKKPKTPARRSWLYGHCMLSRRERTNPLPTEKAGSDACFFPPRPLDWTGGDLFMRTRLPPSSHRKVSCTYRPVSGDVLAKPKLVKESVSFPADTGHLFRPRVCNANS